MNLENKIKKLELIAASGSGKKLTKSRKPVAPKKFMEGEKFMNAKGALYPPVVKEFQKLLSGKYTEILCTGAIGVGKTTFVLYAMFYHLYRLSCLKNPHARFNLDPASEIVFLFQSVNATLAKNVDFQRFKKMLLGSPYFQNDFRPLSMTASEIRFPNGIVVRTGSGLATTALGQNIYACLIDEMNFMAVNTNSLKSDDGGSYDQAKMIYNSIITRRKSRFMLKGKLYGLLCFVSSRRYPDEFTDRLERQVRAELASTGKTSTFVYDKRLWDIKPDHFGAKRFAVFVGSSTHPPCILGDGTPSKQVDDKLVIWIPEEFRSEFESDLNQALRDIAGVSNMVTHPFMTNQDAIANAFGKPVSILNWPTCDFKTRTLKMFPQNIASKQYSRYVHLDLALTSDSAGIACGYVPNFRKMDRGNGFFEIYPNIVFDFVLEIPPPKGGEINFEKIRKIISMLQHYGLHIEGVTADSYQSTDTLQILRQQGFRTGIRSTDKNPKMYDILKAAINDGRVYLPTHDKALKELRELERDAKTGKVNHPPKGSKDLADAIAGVVYGLSNARRVWSEHDINPFYYPASIVKPSGTDGEDGSF